MPNTNTIARVLDENHAGEVIGSLDRSLIKKTIIAMLNDRPQRMAIGQAGRSYAERNFPINIVKDNFIRVLCKIAEHDQPRSSGF